MRLSSNLPLRLQSEHSLLSDCLTSSLRVLVCLSVVTLSCRDIVERKKNRVSAKATLDAQLDLLFTGSRSMSTLEVTTTQRFKHSFPILNFHLYESVRSEDSDGYFSDLNSMET